MENKSDINIDKVDFAFLDSGTGGIPYMLYLKEKCPTVTCVYLGDTINFPYGEKTPEDICQCAINACNLLINKFSPKAIVIACNTISVTALDVLRKTFPETPFVGTVPAIKLAAKSTKNKRIGLLATNQSVSNPYTTKLINDYAKDCYVVKLGEPKLIDFIEKNLFTASDKEKIEVIMPSINFFKEEKVDTIILGCTHYPFLLDVLSKFANRDMFIDPADYFVDFIKTDLEQSNLLNTQDKKGSEEFYVSANPEQFKVASKMFYNVTNAKEIAID